MAETSTNTRITQIGTVIVPVSDQNQALEFYMASSGSRSAPTSRSAGATAGWKWRRREPQRRLR